MDRTQWHGVPMMMRSPGMTDLVMMVREGQLSAGREAGWTAK
jgi:hypothetical protein